MRTLHNSLIARLDSPGWKGKGKPGDAAIRPRVVDADCEKWCAHLDEWVCGKKGLCGARRSVAAPAGSDEEGASDDGE
eukprot:gene30670-51424_t